jgi:hypothetical protein
VPPRHRSLRFGLLEAVALGSVLAGGALVARALRDADTVIGREEAALAFVRRVGEMQKEFKESRRLDRNRDGQPEYGSLEDLHDAGLLEADPRADAAGPHVLLEGYRVEVLLPAEADPTGRRVLTRLPSRADGRLSAQQFAVVAVPSGEVRALRSYYLDAHGWLYGAEGVYDPDRDPTSPPPRLELREERDEGGTDDGPFWRRIEPPRLGTD